MAWVKLDDQFADHPKVAEAGPLAGWLFVCGLTYCGRYLTDGAIPKIMVKRLADFSNVGVEVNPYALADRLVEVGLWEETEAGYHVHSYLDYNPSKAQVEGEREAARVRMGKIRRSPEVRPNIGDCSPEVRLPRPGPGPVPARDTKTKTTDANASGADAPSARKPPANAEVFAALVDVCGADLDRLKKNPAEKGPYQAPAATLHTAGYSAEDVRTMARNWPTHFGEATISAPAISRHASRLMQTGPRSLSPPRQSGHPARASPASSQPEVGDEWDRAFLAKVGAGPPAN